MHNGWSQQPAAGQVAAATRIVFDNAFGQFRQIALGNGLGTSAIEVPRSEFTDLAGARSGSAA